MLASIIDMPIVGTSRRDSPVFLGWAPLPWASFDPGAIVDVEHLLPRHKSPTSSGCDGSGTVTAWAHRLEAGGRRSISARAPRGSSPDLTRSRAGSKIHITSI